MRDNLLIKISLRDEDIVGTQHIKVQYDIEIYTSSGFTVPEIDKVLAPYCEKTVDRYRKELTNDLRDLGIMDITEEIKKTILDKAVKKTYNDLKQSMQGLEVMLNTVVSARGSFPK